MSKILYMMEMSPPARTVLLTANILDIDLCLKRVDITKNEHYSPEYTKINPLRSIPTFIDGKTTICDSHATNTYLIRKYAKNDVLYPKELTRRALVEQRMFFNVSTAFPYLKAIMKGSILKKFKAIPKQARKSAEESYRCLETFLNEEQWMAGDCLTLADITLLPSVNSSDLLIPIDVEKYPKLKDWLKRAQARPEMQKDMEGLQAFKQLAISLDIIN